MNTHARTLRPVLASRSLLPPRGASWLAAALAASLLAPAARPQVAVAKVQEPASNADDFFGSRLASDGSALVVTEFGPDFSGAVHVFDRLPSQPLATGWLHTALVAPSDTAADQRFGEALAIQGDTLLVGAPHDTEHGPDAGAAYVWLRDRNGTPADPADDTWVLSGKLFPTDALPPTPQFGKAVALAGSTAVIGSFQAFGGPATAFAYVFVREDHGTPHDPLDDTFVELARLNSEGSTQSRFGEDVSLSADARTLVVGDELDNAAEPVGAVSVFVREDGPTPSALDDQWLPAAKLKAPPEIFGLGSSLRISGDGRTLLATGSGDEFPFPGIVLVFDRGAGADPQDPLDDTWTESAQLQEPGGGSYVQCFGSDIALSGDLALISAPCFAFGPPFQGGFTFLFERQGDTWSLVRTIKAPDEAPYDGFGGGLALRGGAAFVGASGAPYVDDDPAVEGAAYVYDLTLPDPWTPSYPFPAVPRLTGWGGLQALQPVTVRLYNTFFAFTPAVLVVGAQPLNAPFQGSILEPVPQLLLPLTLGANGDLQLSAPWPGTASVPPGTTLWLQGWIPPAPVTGGEWLASNGLQVTQP